jgi:hypothetical protein
VDTDASVRSLPEVADIDCTAFARSLDRLAGWLDRLTEVAAAGERPAAADARALDTLLAEVWATGGDPARAGLPRRSAAQRHFRRIVGPALWESDVMRHGKVKPRGYPGDFELMRKIYGSRPNGTTPRGRWLDSWLLARPYARAVRNRAAMIVGLLSEVWLAGGRRVCDIACGGAPELAAVHRFLPFHTLTLLDQDGDALREAVGAVGPGRCASIRPLHCPVRALIDDRCRLEPGQDLVYAIGLYDYLSTATATALTERLWAALAPGGRLVIGNFADVDRSDRHLLEAALDWYLRYRTEADLLALLDGRPGLAEARVRTDPTGCLHLLIATRAA